MLAACCNRECNNPSAGYQSLLYIDIGNALHTRVSPPQHSMAHCEATSSMLSPPPGGSPETALVISSERRQISKCLEGTRSNRVTCS